MTAGGATDAINARLAAATIDIARPAAPSPSRAPNSARRSTPQPSPTRPSRSGPMWNVGSWLAPPLDAPVTIDRTVAAAALAKAAPEIYRAPSTRRSPSTPRSASYTVTPAADGAGIDLDAVQGALTQAFVSGSDATLTATVAPVPAPFPTDAAQRFAASLNHDARHGGVLRRQRAHRAARPHDARLLADDHGRRHATDDRG